MRCSVGRVPTWQRDDVPCGSSTKRAGSLRAGEMLEECQLDRYSFVRDSICSGGARWSRPTGCRPRQCHDRLGMKQVRVICTDAAPAGVCGCIGA